MPYRAEIEILAKFQQELVGTWENRDFPHEGRESPVGGNDNPLSYNIMPMPQDSDPDGYILKNFKYNERLKFNDNNVDTTLAIAAEAPNRGGLVSQNCRALFYEQQVKFAEGPGAGNVVHVENGAWLWLPRFVQQDGPYPSVPIDAESVSPALEQPAELMIAKQMSIPHGNSILALGSFDTVADAAGEGCKNLPIISGSPVIPDASSPYPMPANAELNSAPPPSLTSNLNADERYSTIRDSPSDYQNPHPDLTRCPNMPLQQAVAIIQPDSYMHWRVTTLPLQNGRGHVVNIPFEQQVSDVTEYYADYWLLYKTHTPHHHPPKHNTGKLITSRYLAYTQTILMKMKIKGELYVMPHVTCNTVTYV